MATLTELTADVVSHLDEPVGSTRYWTAAELTRWINEGIRDVARRAEVCPTLDTSTAVVAGTGTYNAPSVNMVRIFRIEYVPTGSVQRYPLKPSTVNEMDMIWGVQQTATRSYPMYFCLIGYPSASTSLTIQLYPVPATAGTLRVFYYAIPAALVNGSDNCLLPTGWEDLVVLYAEQNCLRKGKDPRWQEAKALYESRLDEMITKTREYHDQAHSIVTGMGAVPNWLYEFSDE